MMLFNNEDFSQELTDLTKNSQSIDLFKEFFFLSGEPEIYNNLSQDKKVRILIGMLTDMKTEKSPFKAFEFDKEFDFKFKAEKTIVELSEKELVRILKTDFFEKYGCLKKTYDEINQKIKNKSLEIKKTKSNNTTCFNIFHSEAENNGKVLMDTNTIRYSEKDGKTEREGLSILHKNPKTYQTLANYFNKTWDKSVSIFKDGLPNPYWKGQNPFQIYLNVLDIFFTADKSSTGISYPEEITKKDDDDKLDKLYDDKEYQKAAIREGVKKMQQHGGLILADVVGLGKSIIASAIAYNLKEKVKDAEGSIIWDVERIVILVPPKLVSNWEDYSADFRLGAVVKSLYQLENEEVKNTLEKYKGSKTLFIIDEAHKLKNNKSKLYESVKKLTKGSKILLLTATPYSNKIQDIFSLVDLFNPYCFKNERKELKQKEDRLKKIEKQTGTPKNKQFESDKEDLQKEIATTIRTKLQSVVIRRTRNDIKARKHWMKDLNFPIVKDPIERKYTLGNIRALYEDTVDKIENWKGARYSYLRYLEDENSKEVLEDLNIPEGLAKMEKSVSFHMRRLLTLRFESSIGAFKKSLNTYIDGHKVFLDFINKEKEVVVNKKMSTYFNDFDMEDLEDENEASIFDTPKDKILQDKRTKKYPFSYFKPQLKKDIEKDLQILREIKEQWKNINYENDPKIKELLFLIKECQKDTTAPEPNKLIIFSEFKDTVNYLEEYFKTHKEEEFKVVAFHGQNSKSQKNEILKNFKNNMPKDKKKDDYDILISTDALSEGVDLDRSTRMICYDIPYNPTKIIQRFGRINRIGKKEPENPSPKTLQLYHFFPKIEDSKKLIALRKMLFIHNIFGEDGAVIDPTIEIAEEQEISLFTLNAPDKNKEPDLTKDMKRHSENWEKYKDQRKEIDLKAEVSVKGKKNTGNLFLFSREAGLQYFYKIKPYQAQVELIRDEEGLNGFEVPQQAQGTEIYWGDYDYLRAYSKYLAGSKDAGQVDGVGKGSAKERNFLAKLELLKNNYPEENKTILKIQKESKNNTAVLKELSKKFENSFDDNEKEKIQAMANFIENLKQEKESNIIYPKVLFKIEKNT